MTYFGPTFDCSTTLFLDSLRQWPYHILCVYMCKYSTCRYVCTCMLAKVGLFQQFLKPDEISFKCNCSWWTTYAAPELLRSSVIKTLYPEVLTLKRGITSKIAENSRDVPRVPIGLTQMQLQLASMTLGLKLKPLLYGSDCFIIFFFSITISLQACGLNVMPKEPLMGEAHWKRTSHSCTSPSNSIISF